MSIEPRPKFREDSKPALFLELADPDELGVSRPVPVTEFVGSYAKLQFGNGGDWIRKDGSLAKHFNIRRHPEGHGKITHVELQGFTHSWPGKPIPEHIRLYIASKRCAILATSKPQCDQKDGRGTTHD